jgi:hypothetical protein
MRTSYQLKRNFREILNLLTELDQQMAGLITQDHVVVLIKMTADCNSTYSYHQGLKSFGFRISQTVCNFSATLQRYEARRSNTNSYEPSKFSTRQSGIS